MSESPRWSDRVIGVKRESPSQLLDTVLTQYQFFHSIDGPCWVFGLIYDADVTAIHSVGLYDATTPATFNEEAVVDVAAYFGNKAPNYMYPIGFCTDGVTIESYSMHDVIPVSGARFGMDTPAYGPIIGKGGRLAVHSHFNIVCKSASLFVKQLVSMGNVFSRLTVPGQQILGESEGDGDDIAADWTSSIAMPGAPSMYYTPNVVASVAGSILTGLAVFQVMTKRGNGLTDASGIIDRLQLSPNRADLLLLNVFIADPYTAFMGQQPSFIEAKFVSFGLSAEPTPVALKGGVGADFPGVPEDLPDAVNPGTVVAASANGNTALAKGHCGNFPSAVEVPVQNAYHFFGWSAKRLGSMI